MLSISVLKSSAPGPRRANFTFEDLATLMPFAHKRGVHIYVALNSQIVSSEIPELLDTLNSLASLKPDGLIVQDAGIFHLVRRWFPELKLHASTLAAVHNTAGVKALQAMGAGRVVLARELSLGEIEKICHGHGSRTGNLHSRLALLFLLRACVWRAASVAGEAAFAANAFSHAA